MEREIERSTIPLELKGGRFDCIYDEKQYSQATQVQLALFLEIRLQRPHSERVVPIREHRAVQSGHHLGYGQHVPISPAQREPIAGVVARRRLHLSSRRSVVSGDRLARRPQSVLRNGKLIAKGGIPKRVATAKETKAPELRACNQRTKGRLFPRRVCKNDESRIVSRRSRSYSDACRQA